MLLSYRHRLLTAMESSLLETSHYLASLAVDSGDSSERIFKDSGFYINSTGLDSLQLLVENDGVSSTIPLVKSALGRFYLEDKSILADAIVDNSIQLAGVSPCGVSLNYQMDLRLQDRANDFIASPLNLRLEQGTTNSITVDFEGQGSQPVYVGLLAHIEGGINRISYWVSLAILSGKPIVV